MHLQPSSIVVTWIFRSLYSSHQFWSPSTPNHGISASMLESQAKLSISETIFPTWCFPLQSLVAFKLDSPSFENTILPEVRFASATNRLLSAANQAEEKVCTDFEIITCRNIRWRIECPSRHKSNNRLRRPAALSQQSRSMAQNLSTTGVFSPILLF
ncbi:hypothetical protein BDZ45DRAFT_78048 [Acephala macrosclerotiorum]|nr:hypothetical protein BDZ45DRAFT_78048 [Acephala macrosclerotiorum]